MKLWKSPPSTSVILRYFVSPPIIGFIITLISYPEGFRSIGTILYVLLYSYCLGVPSIALISVAGKKLDRYYPWLKKPFKKLVLTILMQIIIVLLVFLMVQITFLLIKKNITKFKFSL